MYQPQDIRHYTELGAGALKHDTPIPGMYNHYKIKEKIDEFPGSAAVATVNDIISVAIPVGCNIIRSQTLT
jgi:hypothetical protein